MATTVASFVRACQAKPVDLGMAASSFESDKVICSPWFTQHYEEHFSRFQNKPIKLLEIGVGGFQYPEIGGDSLRTWQKYFRRGLIYGLDIADKDGIRGPRIRFLRGDQSDSLYYAR